MVTLTSPAPTLLPSRRVRVLPLGPNASLLGPGTEDRIGLEHGHVRVEPAASTRGFEPQTILTPVHTDPQHIRDVRDQICALSGLSKQEIAKALGVDRRSLSGWVSGQTRPDEEHLRRLERLLTLVTDIERAHPTQSGAILRSLTLGGDTLLDLLAQGRYLEIRAWRLLLATLPGPPKGRFPLSRSPVAAPARISNPESIREPLVTQALDRTPRGPRRIPVPSPSPVSRPTP